MRLIWAVLSLLALLIQANAQAGCSTEQSGDFFEVSCTDSNGDPISQAESVILNGETLEVNASLPLLIPRSSFVTGDNTIQVNLNSNGVVATATLSVTIVSQTTREIACRAYQLLDGESVIVECTINGNAFTGPARYAINTMIDPNSIPENMPLTIALSRFAVGTSIINLRLTVDGDDVDGPPVTVTTNRESLTPTCSSAVVDNTVRITCTEGSVAIASYQYSINGGSPITRMGAVDITIGIRSLVSGATNTILVTLLAADGTELGQIPVTINVGSFFRVTCSTQTSSNDLTSNITCIESADSDRIEHYEYSINGGVIQSGTKFPLVINRTRLDFGDSTIDLTLYSVNRDTASVRLILSRNRPFSVQCGAAQSDDGSTIIISCFPTVPESQTIARLQYSINGAEQKFSVLGEDLPVSISVADLNVGQENTFLLILTGSDLAELTISLALRVQDIPPQCMRTIDGNILNISCVEGSIPIVSYQILINGVVLQSGSDFPIVINTNIPQFRDGVNEVMVNLLGATGDVVVFQKIFNVEIIRRSFEVSCQGEFLEDGSVLEIDCTIPAGGQTINSVEYSFNLVSQGIVSLPIRISDSLLTDGINVIGLLVTGSEGSQVSLTLEILRPIKCTYTVTSDVITITCSGGIGAVDRYEYTVNGGQVMTGTRFPITISTDNPDLSPSGNNQVVITLKRANGTTLDVQTISIQTIKGPITLEFPSQVVVSEGAVAYFLSFGMTGASVGTILFSLVPLTYQQFETVTGETVANLFDTFPPAASDGDISAAGRLDLSFGPTAFPLTADFMYNVLNAVNDDIDVEGDEAFILYFNFTESEIDSADLSRLEAGNRTILVTIQDDDTTPLALRCRELVDVFFGGVDCDFTGGSGPFVYTCSYDGGEFENCSPIPLILNFFVFTPGVHVLTVQLTDSAGSSQTFIYSFTGKTVPDFVLEVNTSYITAREGGSGGSVEVSKTGYSFGEVNFSLRPLTYSEYPSFKDNLDSLLPFTPLTEASSEDFNGLVASYSFRAGLVPEPSVVFSSSGLALSDSLPEFTEGFLLYLDINERSLDARDLQRLQTGNFKVVNPLVVVSVPSNDLPFGCRTSGSVLQSLSLDCTGDLPPDVIASTLICFYSGLSKNCSTFPVEIGTSTASTGSYIVTVSGSTSLGETIALGEVTFSVPDIDFYFFNDTPLLVGGTVSAQFRADRTGLITYCHLTHFDDFNFREDCSSGTYRRTGIPPGDYTLRVIAYDPVRGDKKVIRNRLWVQSDDPNNAYCITYLKNRGWRVVNGTFIVEFTATGVASGADAEFECALNRNKPVPCTSPLVLSGLSPGVYRVRIRPVGCGRDYRVWNTRFTIA
jgi:hypothetical protein